MVTWRAVQEVEKGDEEEVEFEVAVLLKKDELADHPWCWTAVGLSYDVDMVRGNSILLSRDIRVVEERDEEKGGMGR